VKPEKQPIFGPKSSKTPKMVKNDRFWPPGGPRGENVRNLHILVHEFPRLVTTGGGGVEPNPPIYTVLNAAHLVPRWRVTGGGPNHPPSRGGPRQGVHHTRRVPHANIFFIL
jgi:hypothetical protein